jgi:hypothetical protein
MPIEIPDLWSDDIKVDVLPPLVILKAQDEAIRKKTGGILHSVITTGSEFEDDQEYVTYTMDLVAPALGYRESILTVSHRQGKFYPATIVLPEAIGWSTAPGASSSTYSRCYSADEFIQQLRIALQSQPTRSTITSLLASSNEAKLRNGEGSNSSEQAR